MAAGSIDYCHQHRLENPEYTGYTQGNRFRYEVDVGGLQYFSVEKSYKSVPQAIHASAHYALYCLLLGNIEDGLAFTAGSSPGGAIAEPSPPFMVHDALKVLSEALNNNPRNGVAHIVEIPEEDSKESVSPSFIDSL